MAYPKKGKNTILKPIGRVKFEDLTDEYKEAIVNHASCFDKFKTLAGEARVSVSEHSELIISSFSKLLPELPDTQLNVAEGEKEFKPLFDILTEKYEGTYPVNTGLFILMMTLIRKSAGKLYCSSINERLLVFRACDKIAEEMQNLLIPIRDKCIAEFYETCTQDEWDEVRDTVKHRADPKNQGMPGNMGVQQFGR